MTSRIQRCIAALVVASMTVSSVAMAGTVRSLGPQSEGKICTTAPSVYYINGIMAPSEVAEAAAAVALEDRFDRYGQAHDGDIVSIYNPSEGLVLDIFRKLLAQKFGEAIGTAWGFIEQTWRALGGVSSTLSGADLDDVKQVARDSVATTVLNGLDPAAKTTLDNATVEVMTAASFGQKMLIVAHSQGNMFAKELYTRTQMAVPNQYNKGAYEVAKQFQVVNVGTPATTPDTGKYVTSIEDIVIDLLARLLSTLTSPFQPAVATFNSGTDTYKYDVLGHDFLNVYLNYFLGLEGKVMELTASAAKDAGSFGYDNPEGPLLLEGFAQSGQATYTVTAPDGSILANSTVTNAPSVFFQPTCDQLVEGTYQVRASVTSTPDQMGAYTAFTELDFPRLGPSKLVESWPFAFNYVLNGPATDTVVALDIVLTKDTVNGGFDFHIYNYKQQ